MGAAALASSACGNACFDKENDAGAENACFCGICLNAYLGPKVNSRMM